MQAPCAWKFRGRFQPAASFLILVLILILVPMRPRPSGREKENENEERERLNPRRDPLSGGKT